MPSPEHLHQAYRDRPGFCWLTAAGASALSLLYVRGGDSVLGGALRDADDTPRLTWLRDRDGQRLDQAMYARHGAGVLVTCHGGAGVREAVERELKGQGLEPLRPGEIDLNGSKSRFQGETLSLLPAAAGDAAVRIVIEAAGEAEALRSVLRDPSGLPALLEASRGARFLFEPPRVQLWGPVNAGKSSLLNALCGRTLAATGEEPGLTRDTIEGRLHHRGFVIRLFDAPGLGASGAVDAEAVTLAEKWRGESDLTIELTPPGLEPTGAGDWAVASRADERDDAFERAVSIHHRGSLETLKERLVGHFFGGLISLPRNRRFVLLPALRDDLRALAEGRATPGALIERWLS